MRERERERGGGGGGERERKRGGGGARREGERDFVFYGQERGRETEKRNVRVALHLSFSLFGAVL